MKVTTTRGNFWVFWKYRTKGRGDLPHFPGNTGPDGEVCCAIVPDGEDTEPMASRWVAYNHHNGVRRNKYEPQNGHWRRVQRPNKRTAAKWAFASVIQAMIPREEFETRRTFWHQYFLGTRLGAEILKQIVEAAGILKKRLRAVEKTEDAAP